MKDILPFARLFLFKPVQAAEACRRRGAFSVALAVYAAWAVLSLCYAYLNPLSRLDPNAPVLAAHGGIFWLQVALWEPVISASSVALTVLSLSWMRDGWLPLKTAVATLWSAAPLVFSVAYARSSLTRTLFAAAMVAWAAPGALLWRRVPSRDWRLTATFLLGLNAIGIISLIPQFAVLLAGSLQGYYAVAIVTTVWMLVCAGAGLRALFGISAPRAVLAFLFGFAALQCFIAAAFFLHWIPTEVLKVLVYV